MLKLLVLIGPTEAVEAAEDALQPNTVLAVAGALGDWAIKPIIDGTSQLIRGISDLVQKREYEELVPYRPGARTNAQLAPQPALPAATSSLRDDIAARLDPDAWSRIADSRSKADAIVALLAERKVA